VKVILPSPLTDYTDGKREVAAQIAAAGAALDDALRDLDRQFPGIRFRMIDEQDRVRPHIKLFVNGVQQRKLDAALRPDDELLIVAALSGG
jgi:sulfur-carrier protein